MKMDIKVENLVKPGRVVAQMAKDDQTGLFAASEWRRLINDYVPMDRGNLADNARLAPWEINYLSPYAGPQYRGDIKGSPITYSLDKHPLASARWDEAAAPAQGEKLDQAIEAYINKKDVDA